MGRVYKAFDPLAQRPVAIKIPRSEWLTPDTRAEYLARFQREAQAASRLAHPDVVTVFDVGEDYFVMELLEGATLQALLRDRVRFEVAEAVRLLRPIAEALDFAHTRGVVHRDVKPGNIMVVPSGRPKLMDFGVAHIPAAVITAAGQFFGSPSYMAPEQILESGATPAADLFSLAVVAYEMLTGQRPFAGDSISAITYRVVNEPHLPPSRWNPGLLPGHDAVFDRALAKDPKRRYPTGAAFVTGLALEDLEDPLTALLTSPSGVVTLSNSNPVGAETHHRHARPARRPWAPWSIAGAAVLALSAVAFVRGPTVSAPVFLGDGLPVRANSTPGAAAVGLEIETRPAGALVTVDGIEAGRSPVFMPRLRPGAHTVRVSRPGFSPAELSLELAAGSPPVPLRFSLQPVEAADVGGPGPPSVPAAAPKTEPTSPRRIVPPRRIAGALAAYPDAARRLRLEGTVALDILVDSKGRPAEMRVVRSAGELLDEAVLAAARTWRFEPARRGTTPISARYPYRHHFERSGASAGPATSGPGRLLDAVPADPV